MEDAEKQAWLKVSQWAPEIEQKKFNAWVVKKAASLWKRDKSKLSKIDDTKKINDGEKRAEYRDAIYKAIAAMEVNKCPYTGDKLEWEKIGTWKNDDAKAEGKDFKKKFALMPTIDHKNAEPKPDFVICSWIANDAKNDLTQEDFIKLCKSVLIHHGYTVSAPSGVSGLSQEN